MPIYEYKCATCGRQAEALRTMAVRNRVIKCTCPTGYLWPIFSLIAAMPMSARAEVPPMRKRPMMPGQGILMDDISIDNCRVGIRMDGGHLTGRGLRITNTPTGLELNRGATVDITDAFFDPERSREER